MGGLTRLPSRENRGQLLLAGAFILGVTLIGLTLVFSASNYTETIAGEQNAVSQGDDAVDLRETVQASLGSYLGKVNADPTLGDSDFDAVVDDLSAGTGDQFARRAQAVTIESAVPPTAPKSGIRVKRSSLGSQTGASSWTVSSSVERVRNMTFKLTSVPSASDQHFEIQFNTSSGDDWQIDVYESGPGPSAGTREWTTEVRKGSTLSAPWSFESTCTTVVEDSASSRLYLNVSDAELRTSRERKHCSALEELDPEPQYDIGIEFNSGASGKFWYIQRGGSVNVPPPDTDSVLYSETVFLIYNSPHVVYRTDIRIAPGEIG